MKMAVCPPEIKRKDVPFEEALEITGEGLWTRYMAFVCGLATLSAISSMQSMYFILPAVGCEMALSHVQRAILGSVTFLGSVTSSNVFGFLVDQYGRRKILLISTFGTCLFSLISSLSPPLLNPLGLIISTFCAGLALGGVFGVPHVYLSEFCNSKIRSKYITIVSMISMLANAYSPSIAWLVTWLDIQIHITDNFIFTSWRLYIILNVLPMFLSGLMFLNLPESAKYLLFKGKKSEALDIMAFYYKINSKKPKSEFPIGSLCLDEEDEAQRLRNSGKGNGLKEFFLTMGRQVKELFLPPHLLYTSICSLLMFGAIGLYGVVQLWIPEQASRMLQHIDMTGEQDISLCEIMSSQNSSQVSTKCQIDSEIFLISTTIGLAFFALSIVMVFLVQKIKPKTIFSICTVVSSGICFFIVYSKSIYGTITLLGAMVAILGASLSLVFSFIVDFFPTSLRASATAVSLFFGRLTVPIGSALLGAAFEAHCQMAYLMIASSLAVVGGVCALAPLNKKKN